jgi:hypothetical protein
LTSASGNKEEKQLDFVAEFLHPFAQFMTLVYGKFFQAARCCAVHSLAGLFEHHRGSLL